MEPGSSRAASDAGSVTGSFTGSLGGTSTADGPKKRGRKKKGDKDRDDVSRVGTRVGSMDPDTMSVRDGAAAGGGDEAGDEEEDQDVEGELLGATEGFHDIATEKKNLA